MQTMVRETWTDERLEDLNKKVDDGFAHLEKSVDNRFGEVGARLDRVDKRLEFLAARFDALNRTLIGGFFVMIATLIGVAAT